MSNFVVYKITNIINSKFYIGSTKHFTTRKREHIYTLNKNTHRNSYLQRAWNKYGEKNFKFEILEENIEKENLILREQYYLDQLKPYIKKIGYNLNPTAGSNLGFKMPKSAIEKIRQANTGKKHSVETRKKISEVQKGKKRKFISKLLTSKKCRGERNPAAKLDWEKVRQIREKKKTGVYNTELAKEYNVSPSLISAIIKEQIWKEGEYYVDTTECS
jgi:group I intron endonuclease